MIACSQCGASLTATDVVELRCARCGATIDPKATHLGDAGMATVDLPAGGGAAGSGAAGVGAAGVGGGANDFEIGGQAVDPRATHLEGAGMATVDLPAGDGLSGAGGARDDGADFEVGGKPPTVVGPMIDATYAFDAGRAAELAREMEGPKSKTVVEHDVRQTIDLPSMQSQIEDDKNRTHHDAGIAATYDSDQFGEAPVAGDVDLSLVWGKEFTVAGNPRHTIKAAEKAQPRNDQTLIVNTRAVRQVEAKVKSGVDYELVDKLGEGGMGVVYASRQTSIDRTVAIKMLKPAASNNRDLQQKFLSEAVVTGDLDHPNIVPIYDLGKNESGALFYAMKRVQGTPWSKVIAIRSQVENLDTLLKVADAVAFAHSRGVVHRDLKPENVMLGEFGEVLVMDWGLAYSTPAFRKSGSITQTHSMGGSPAYMAPEMAIGPIERITPASDVYLLGAILYEIVTGRPPHSGSNVSQCLVSAARNEIVPTDKRGELVEIALRAMSTKPADRYESVLALQTALRSYLSHNESIALASRADEDLAAARAGRDYQVFARAVFGFEEAAELWPENRRAVEGARTARRAYAEAALAKADFDLGLGLVENRTEFEALAKQLAEGKREREARQIRLRQARRLAAGLVVVLFAVGGAAFFGIRAQRDRAVLAEGMAKEDSERARQAEGRAKEDRDLAIEAEKKATTLLGRAVAAEQDARRQQGVAQAAREKAEQSEKDARQAQADAIVQRNKATEAKQVAETAKVAAETAKVAAETAKAAAVEAKVEAEVAQAAEAKAAYVAKIGLAAAKIEENAFDGATELLDSCPPELRGWEWGRLKYLCGRSKLSIDAGAPVVATAVDASGKRVAAAGWDGTVAIWNLEDGGLVRRLRYGGTYANAAAFSPDGATLAVGGSDREGYVRLWSTADGKSLVAPKGHRDTVLSVSFDRTGKRLLTSSYDGTARLWNTADGSELAVFRGHSSWVWSAAFSPDEKTVVTAGQDGSALVWDVAAAIERHKRNDPDDGEIRAFMGHGSPVHGATFSPDGKLAATTGDDGRVLVWNPADVRPYKLAEVFAETQPAPPAARELKGPQDALFPVVFSPDGKRLAAGSRDNGVYVWQLDSEGSESAGPAKVLRGHAGEVRGLAFAGDGKLVSGSHDGLVKLWDVDGYSESQQVAPHVFAGHADAVLAADFAPDGWSIVTAGRDRTAKVWDTRTATETQTLAEGHAFLASSVVPFDNDRRIVTAAVDGTARIWDVATGAELVRLPATGRSAAVDVSPDGTLVLTGGAANTAELRDVDGKPVHTLKHNNEVTAVAFAPDGATALTGEASGRVNLWNVKTGTRVWTSKAHSLRITAALFVDGGKQVFTASLDRTVGSFDAATGEENVERILKHATGVTSAARLGDAAIVTAADDGRIRMWNHRTATLVEELPLGEGRFTSAAVARDGGMLLAVDPNAGLVRRWDLRAKREIGAAAGRAGGAGAGAEKEAWLDVRRAGGLLWSAALLGDGRHAVIVGGDDARLVGLEKGTVERAYRPHGAVAGTAFSPDGRRIATAGGEGAVKIWSVDDGRSLRRIETREHGGVGSVRFSPDGRLLLTAGDDGTARLWRADDGAEERRFVGHTGRVTHAAFSADGRRIVTGSIDKTARIWSATDETPPLVLEGHEWGVLWAEFSIDGKYVVTASSDHTVRVWDVKTGKPIRTLAGHTSGVAAAAFSPDGLRIVTGGQDAGVKLWDAASGEELLALRGHTGEITSVRFSRDGRSVLTSSRDGTAVVWPTIGWHAKKDEPRPAGARASAAERAAP